MSDATNDNRIIFRDLAGIQEIERQYLDLLDNRLMADEIAELEQTLDDKSIELFGITQMDTAYWHRPGQVKAETSEEWERHFEFIDELRSEESDFWDFFGIDVTDERGDQLGCIYAFGRQLVCALKRLHPDAILTFRKGEQSDDQLEAAAEAWGSRLLRGNGRR